MYLNKICITICLELLYYYFVTPVYSGHTPISSRITSESSGNNMGYLGLHRGWPMQNKNPTRSPTALALAWNLTVLEKVLFEIKGNKKSIMTSQHFN